MSRLRLYALLVRLNKPIGIFLLLWPALWALWIAGGGSPGVKVVLVFVLGVVLMRSAGCAINDFADREFDPLVSRTRERPLAAGLIAPAEAVAVFVVLCLTAFGLVLLLNPLTVLMSLVAVFLAVLYPFTKRYTHVPQLFLGAAFGWAVPMAFAAETGGVPMDAWLIFLATILWAVSYDTEYAMVDREDDLRIGVKSTAILFGDWDRVMVGLSQVLMMALLVWVGARNSLGTSYYLGLVAAGAFAFRQQVLMRERDAGGCFMAFLNNNCLGMAIFIGLFLDYLLA